MKFNNFFSFFLKLLLFFIVFGVLYVIVFAISQGTGYYDWFGPVGGFPAIALLGCIFISYNAVKNIDVNFYFENVKNYFLKFFDNDKFTQDNSKGTTDRISKLEKDKRNEAIGYLKTGNQEFKKNNFSNAIKYYTKAIEIDSNFTEARNNRDKAIRQYKKSKNYI